MTDIPMPPGGPRSATPDPTPQGGEEAACLVDLHIRLVDTLSGYDKVIEKAEPEFLGVAEAFRSLHQSHCDRVAVLLAGLGEEGRDEGSMIGTVNRAAVEIRSWFDDIGHNVMDALVDGEEQVLAAFRTAIEASPSPERRGVLQQMQGELEALLREHVPDRR